MKVFFREGRFNATTQDIADAAGINRTLIHYYFRSKELLLLTAFEKTQEVYNKKTDAILLSDLPFKEKTERFIDDFLKKLEDYPYLEPFWSSEIMYQQMGKESLLPVPENPPPPLLKYIKEVEAEMQKGTIKNNKPIHFLMNLFSLMVHPILMKPLQKNLFGIDENKHQAIIRERKKIIMDILFMK